MRWAGGAWMGLGLACSPAVPVDTSAGSDPVDMASDDGLPPITSSSAFPLPTTGDDVTDTTSAQPRYDVSGGVTSGPIDDPCRDGWMVPPLPPAVALVLDVSGSMVDVPFDHDADPMTPATTRWFALRIALETALYDWDPTHDLGLRTFPSPQATTPPDPFACDSDGQSSIPAPMGASQVLSVLPDPNDMTLAGASPMRAAVNEALALLSVVDAGKQRFMVIIADGAPNCAPMNVPPSAFDDVDVQVQDVIYAESTQASAPV